MQWVGLITSFIFAVCIVGIIIIAIKEKKKTGKYPGELREENHPVKLTVWVMAALGAVKSLPDTFFLKPFLAYVIPGIDVATIIMILLIIGIYLAKSFRSDWTWRVGFWQSAFLLIFVIVGYLIYADLRYYYAKPWFWYTTPITACILLPLLFRVVCIAGFHDSRFRVFSNGIQEKGNI